MMTTCPSENKKDSKDKNYKIPYNYCYVALALYLHPASLYGIYLCFTSAKLSSIIFNFIYGLIGQMGVTAGAHRLWSHNSYKATLPLHTLLMLMYSIAGQQNATYWVMEHRLHHKYVDTNADPHSAGRGVFYSHMGWLLLDKHPDYLSVKDTVYMEDVNNNPALQFQKRFSWMVIGIMCIILPTLIVMYCFGESLNCAWHITILRFVYFLHKTFLVNSISHLWGYRPYDKSISATNNIALTIMTNGESYHNYHHVFPWDYRSAELGNNYLNVTKWFIDFFALIGWAYDLKSVREEVILARKNRTGDGTNIWGWEDKDFKSEDRIHETVIHHKKIK